MALVEGCKHQLEIEVPASEVQQETERIVANIQKKVKLPGFRPGKAPASLIRGRFQSEIRQDVLESLLPKAFAKRAEQDGLKVVGRPDVTDVHFHDTGEVHFKIEFEVVPEIVLGEYRNLPVEYEEPEVSSEDVETRLTALREQKAEFVNEDPRPLQEGDFAVVALKSISGLAPGESPVESENSVLELGSNDTVAGFREGLVGLSPEEEKDIEVTYPEDYGQQKLAGRTVTFRVRVKAVRRKELPEMNDEFARDLGDFQNLDELREAIRKTIFAERQYLAQSEAKGRLVDELVRRHEFPVPNAYVEAQIRDNVEQQIRQVAGAGVDPRKLNLDWDKIGERFRDESVKQVKGSLLLERLAETESIHATTDEVDREVARLAKQEREPVAAFRMKLEKSNGLGRLASRIRTEKVLNFLFENARKMPKSKKEESPAPAE